MPNKKYCSRTCANSDPDFVAARNKKIKEAYSNKIITSNKCVWCNSLLNNRQKRFCSKKCKSEESNSRLKKNY